MIPILFLILSTNLWAQKTHQKIDRYEVERNIRADSTHTIKSCHENNKYLRFNHSFQGEVQCSILCRNGKKHSINISKNFNDKDMQLTQGDGGLPASFNVNLNNWVEKICLYSAFQKCGSINEVQSSKFLKLTSGQWSYSGNSYCPKTNEKNLLKKILRNYFSKIIIHPFDKSSNTISSNNQSNLDFQDIETSSPGFNLGLQNTKLTFNYLMNTYVMSEKFYFENSDLFNNYNISKEKLYSIVLQKHQMNQQEFIQWRLKDENIQIKECQYELNLLSCYGDCINGSNWVMEDVKATTSESKKICADNLISFLSTMKIPKELYENYCRIFINDTIISDVFKGDSCSAFRYNDPCKSFFKNLKI